MLVWFDLQPVILFYDSNDIYILCNKICDHLHYHGGGMSQILSDIGI